MRLANSFVSSGQDLDLPGIGLGIDSQIISGSSEGAADATSLAVHPGHKDSANTLLEVRFSPTGPVQFSGAVTELGVHCGGVDVWVYAGPSLVASTTALNTDAAWSFASSVATSGVIRVFVGPGSDWSCDHSQISLTVSPSPQYIFTTKASLKTAVQAYNANPAAATAEYGPIADWDVSAVTDMSYLFKDLTNFNADISNWNTSSVTNMYEMFRVRPHASQPAPLPTYRMPAVRLGRPRRPSTSRSASIRLVSRT